MTQCSAPTLSLTINASNNRVSIRLYYDASGNVNETELLLIPGTPKAAWLPPLDRLTLMTETDLRVEQIGKEAILVWAERRGAGGERLERETFCSETSGDGSRGGTTAQLSARDHESVNGPVANVYYFLSRPARLGEADREHRPERHPERLQPTTPTGCIVAESDYYPYGGERIIDTLDATSNTYKFTGNERDTESGLDHTDNRQYSSNTGRWLAADPHKGRAGTPQSWGQVRPCFREPGNADRSQRRGLFRCRGPGFRRLRCGVLWGLVSWHPRFCL